MLSSLAMSCLKSEKSKNEIKILDSIYSYFNILKDDISNTTSSPRRYAESVIQISK
jgi:hypothetical protein